MTFLAKLKLAILHHFELSHNGGSAMNCADLFRHDEWRVLDSESAHANLLSLGDDDEKLRDFIHDVVSCMRVNVELSEGA